jgi:hypothetical protein
VSAYELGRHLVEVHDVTPTAGCAIYSALCNGYPVVVVGYELGGRRGVEVYVQDALWSGLARR